MANTFEGGWKDEEIGKEYNVEETPYGKFITLKNPIPEKQKKNYSDVKVYFNCNK